MQTKVRAISPSGAEVDLRASAKGDLQLGTLADAVMRGNVFAVANQVGVTSQAGFSATTPVLTLYNPAGSGKNLAVWYAGALSNVIWGAVSAVHVCVGTDTVAAAVTGTLTTAHRNLLLGSSSDPSGVPMLAATLPNAPVSIAILGAGLTGAVNLLPNTPPLSRWFNGALVLKPGTNMSIQTIAASGAAGLICEYIWEEIDE